MDEASNCPERFKSANLLERLALAEAEVLRLQNALAAIAWGDYSSPSSADQVVQVILSMRGIARDTLAYDKVANDRARAESIKALPPLAEHTERKIVI